MLYAPDGAVHRQGPMKIPKGYFPRFVLQSGHGYTKRKDLRLCLLDSRSKNDKISNTACK